MSSVRRQSTISWCSQLRNYKVGQHGKTIFFTPQLPSNDPETFKETKYIKLNIESGRKYQSWKFFYHHSSHDSLWVTDVEIRDRFRNQLMRMLINILRMFGQGEKTTPKKNNINQQPTLYKVLFC